MQGNAFFSMLGSNVVNSKIHSQPGKNDQEILEQL